MRAGSSAIMCLAASAPAAAQTTAPSAATHLYGPPPTWETFRTIAEEGVREQLLDPESARFTWTTGYYKGLLKPFLGTRYEGYVACGRVNARNRLGGYVGTQSFVVVIDYGRLLHAELARPRLDLVTKFCADMSARGAFVSIERIEEKTAPAADAGNSPTGLTLRAMPDGAYVSAVAGGSAAAAAGLKPGMVIASVNGIALAPIGDGMTKVVEAAHGEVTLGIVGGVDVKLRVEGPR